MATLSEQIQETENMRIEVIHANAANHPNYDVDVKKCGGKHGASLRRWGEASRNIWFCQHCGHRVEVKIQGD